MCLSSTSTSIIETSLTHPHPLDISVSPPSILSRDKTGLSKSEVQPEGCDTGSKETVYPRAHIHCHSHCHSTKHDTHTRSFLPSFKPETGEGLQCYKAEPFKGNLPCIFDITLRRNCWHMVIIFDKRPKYLCTSIPTRNDVEHLSSLYIYLCKVQGGSNMTGTDLCVNKPHCAAAVRPLESEATTSTLPPARVRTCSVLSGSC